MHFTLLVAHTNKYNLEELMEPYWQDTDDERYVQTDITLNGDIFSIKDYIGKQFVHEAIQLDYWKHQPKGKISKGQVDWHAKSIKRLTEWAVQTEKDLDQVKQEICDYEGWEVLDNGDLGTKYNHNMEWDWYVVGGRWDGLYVMKNGDHKNIFLKKDLDLEKTREAEKKRYGKIYDECVEQGKKNGWPEENWIWGYDKVPTREKYIKDKVGDDFWITYGYLDEDWVTREQIDDKDGTWAEQFKEWFDSLPDDTELTLVDYHM